MGSNKYSSYNKHSCIALLYLTSYEVLLTTCYGACKKLIALTRLSRVEHPYNYFILKASLAFLNFATFKEIKNRN